MNYIIEEIENGIVVKGLRDFDPEHIFENGQAFRWEKTGDKSYIVVHGENVAEFILQGEDLKALNCSREDFINVWHNYFNLDTDYGVIKEGLKNTKAYSVNDSLKEAMEFGSGLRILNQDHFEMIISFIISANNRIPQIKKCIELLSQHYGQSIGFYKDKEYFRFPKPEELAYVDVQELKEITRVGFRNTRIVNAARQYYEHPENFENVDKETLSTNLLALEGVGPKVLDCILLFGYGEEDTFPVDVWVKRLMETLYLDGIYPNKKILEFAEDLFGDYMGHAQQYLFYYARENSIGK